MTMASRLSTWLDLESAMKYRLLSGSVRFLQEGFAGGEGALGGVGSAFQLFEQKNGDLSKTFVLLACLACLPAEESTCPPVAPTTTAVTD